ncbi:methyl-accepting chemotaxis protein [Azospirillum griseum]|nr:methyl-accepting chemotaxis protein [Azospirillum griseum]
MLTSSPSTAPSRHRFGVRAKLRLAFTGMAGLTIAAVLVGLWSFAAVEDPLGRIVGNSLPGLELAKRLAVDSGGLVMAAPTLEAADRPEERERRFAEIQARGRALVGLVDALEARQPGTTTVAALRNGASALIAVLEEANTAVAERQAIRTRRDNALAALGRGVDAFTEQLAPIIESTGIDLRTQGDTLGVSLDWELDGVADALAGLLNAEAQRAAVAILSESAPSDTQEATATALASLRALRANAPTTHPIDPTEETLNRLTAPDPATRAAARAALERETAVAAGAYLQDLQRAADAARALGRESLPPLLTKGLGNFRAYLEIGSHATTVAGLLREAAQAVDDRRLTQLEEQFASARVLLTNRLKPLRRTADVRITGLLDAADHLLSFGSGDSGLFALRRAELAVAQRIQRILDDSRSLATVFSDRVGEQTDRIKAEADTDALAALQAMAAGRYSLALVAAVSLIAALALGWLVVRRMILAPLHHLSQAMRAIAAGRLDTPIPATRADEIGEMTQALTVFRDIASRTRDAHAQAEAERERAAQERRRTMIELAESFENRVRSVLDRVAAAADAMQTMAQRMSDNARTTTRETSTAADTSRLAEDSVQAVAAATDTLSRAIRDIGDRVQRSSVIARDAVGAVARSNRTIDELSDSTRKIGAVMQLINGIASQTNLLALNATIEAAHAGDAGKGFAVVAHEVKALAGQVGAATEDIARQIASMRTVAEEAVEAIQSIDATIRHINDLTNAVALSAEEQSRATQDIARNVLVASDGSMRVRGSIESVARAATESGATAGQVLSASSTVLDEIHALSQQVERLVEHMRAG